MENTQFIIQKDTTANPGPLGLCGFGLSTVLLNLHNAGLFGMDTMILAMGIFLEESHKLLWGLWNGRRITSSALWLLHLMVAFGLFWLLC